MLLKFMVENFRGFSSEVELNLEADLRTQKFRSNIIMNSQGNSVKAAAIYGPNNTGKTCLLNAVSAYRAVLLNKPYNFSSNLFSESHIVKLGAVFLWSGKRFLYSFRYDTKSKIFVEEEFMHSTIDQYGNEIKRDYFKRNSLLKLADSSDAKLKEVMNLSSKDNILINTLDTSDIRILQEAKEVLRGFANSITVLSMQSLQPYKTIEMLKTPDSSEAKQIVTLIKQSDLDIDDFRYDEKSIDSLIEFDEEEGRSKGVNHTDKIIEMFKLISVHKGMPIPSIIFDSLGTKKVVSLAGYLVECLSQGGILLIDELDSGIHFKLSRAIVSLFNSILNNSAQLIFTTHDVSLLDIKTLFRKEQIWFTDKDDKQLYLYSLSKFTAQNSGIRLDSDLYEYYSKGLLGALPDPSLIDILIEGKSGDGNE